MTLSFDMLVSPSEPLILRAALGESNALPEKYGCDIVFATSRWGMVGIQRKAWQDFFASCANGMMGKEVAKMKAAPLAQMILLVEGRIEYSMDGVVTRPTHAQRWTRASVRGQLHTIRNEGFTVDFTASTEDTIAWCQTYELWCKKVKHVSLKTRPKSETSAWGTRGNEDWELHTLCSIPGVNAGRAKMIRDHFGELPLCWKYPDMEARLLEIRGIGQKMARDIAQSLKELPDENAA